MLHSEFIEKHGVKFSVKPVQTRPGKSQWTEGSRHFRFRLRYQDRTFKGYFSQGPAYKSNPRGFEILQCLQVDCSGIDQRTTFENWCAEWGYDSDSRSAYSTWKACWRTWKELEHLFGPGVFEEFQELRED